MKSGRLVMLHCGIGAHSGGLVRRAARAAAALLLAAGLPAAALADDDLPGRVGRVADVAGHLYQSPGDRASEWAEIGVNYPVTSGDNLWLSADGRAEVDFGGGQLRLAGDANLHLSRLDDRELSLFVAQGRVIVRIRALDPGDTVRIDAPNAQLQLTRAGLYRIDVSPDRLATVVTVREGEVLVALADGSQQALPGQTATITGQDPVVAEVRNGIGQDGFDAWSANRDHHYEQGASAAYVSRQMVGYADLDRYGNWQQVPDVGAVWFPNAVAADWAPYSDGYWANVGGWGATWVDAAPWGYAPFHYGRWASVGGRWGWCPGSYVARPWWAPALVAWQGGPRWGLSASVGSPVYGWLPLGWRDPYLPVWRGCSSRCWTRFNQPYGVESRERPRVPPTRYANSDVPGAVTAVGAATLVGAHPVAVNRVRVPPQFAAAAPALGAPPPLALSSARLSLPRPGAAPPPPASTLAPSGGSRAGHADARPGVVVVPQLTLPDANAAAPAARRGQGPPARIAAPVAAPPQPGARGVETPPVLPSEARQLPSPPAGIALPPSMAHTPTSAAPVVPPSTPPRASPVAPAAVQLPSAMPQGAARAVPQGVPQAVPRSAAQAAPQGVPQAPPQEGPAAPAGHVVSKPAAAAHDAPQAAVPGTPVLPAAGGLNR